jgi:mono/diheme cytochrome c family protein
LDLHRFVDDGAGFKTERIVSPIVSTSKAFRPVDVSVGPDGALYACDWFNAVIGHYQASYADPRRDRSHGRIWRITAKGLPAVKQPDLISMSESDLFAQLGSPERWTRYQARRLLFHRSTEKVVAAADAFIAKNRPEAQLLEASGVLQAHAVVRPALLDVLQSSSDFRVRAYAARVAGDWSAQLPDPQVRLAKAIADAHPRVRLEAVVALSHVGGQASLLTALGAVTQPTDKFLDYALRQTVRHLAPTAGKLAAELPAPQAAYLKKAISSGPAVVTPGQAIYEALCLNCHQAAGQGLSGVYPPLAQSEWVSGDAQTLMKIVMHGLAGPTKVMGKDYGLVPMPPMGLDDQQLADVLTYVRGAFGNKAAPVKVEDVKAVRASTQGRTAPWTASELGK